MATNHIEDTLDFVITGCTGETEGSSGLLDIVWMITGWPFGPDFLGFETRSGKQWHEGIDAECVRSAIGKNAPEDFVEQSAALAGDRENGKILRPDFEALAPGGVAAIEFEVLGEATVGMARGAQSAEAPATAFFHIERIDSEQEHIFGGVGAGEF